MDVSIVMELSIVTVTMNHLTYIKRLLKSVFDDHRPSMDFEFVLVDNCSTDGTVDYVRKHYPQVIILQNDKVAGFATNNNKGALASRGKVLAFINPDIQMLEGALDDMVTCVERNQGVGIVCPQLLNEDLSIQYSVRRFMSLKILLNRFLSLGHDHANNATVSKYLLKDLKVTNGFVPVDWAIGAAFVMRREVYQANGGFDERFFLYVEDMDFCLRCWQHGKMVVFLPSVTMIHAHRRLSRNFFNRHFWIHLHSACYFFYKHGFYVKSMI